MSRCNNCKHMMCPFPEDMCIELCVCTLQTDRLVANVYNKTSTKTTIVFITRSVNNEYLSC